jgi:PAS domain S-box-containing protein
MSRPVWTIDHESPAFEASLIMKERRVRRLVVVGLDGRVCGVVTQSDIIRGLESKYVKTLKNVLETREDELAEAGRSLVEKTIYLDNILRSSIDMGIAATDKSYRITYFNPAAEKLLGVKAQDVSGRDVRELHVAQGVPLARLHAAFEAVVREGGHSFELKRAIDGRQRLIKARVTGIWDKGEEPLGFVLMLRDVTERRRAQEDVKRLTRNLEELVVQRTSQLAEKARELEEANVRLQELDEVKSAFLAEVSHELRTPLTSLLGFAKLISRDFVKLFAPLAGDDPKLSRKQQRIRENLGVMVHEGERLTRLINDLLDLSRIESGRMEWRDELVCAADIVERAVEAVAGQFSQNPDVTLNAQSSDALPRLRVDPDRLQQVLINLLNNAAKFTARGEVQVVAGLGRNERVRFTVSDTGPGLGPDDLENVFEKFRQSSSEDTTGGRKLGAGLGLAICREIVEHYGGRIWVESEQGRGSAFSFEIPTDESLRAAVAEEQPVAGRESRLILVADDDPGVCSYLLQLLASQGYSAAAAHDGASAIQAASRLEPDLIVMDLAMPGMTGQSAIDRMRKDPKLANIPVLVVTGLLKNGAAVGDACLHKPVDEAEFLAAVDRLLQKP